MFASAFRSVVRRSGLIARPFAVPKKDTGRVEITKPATHPDFSGYINSVQFRQHAEPFMCYRCCPLLPGVSIIPMSCVTCAAES